LRFWRPTLCQLSYAPTKTSQLNRLFYHQAQTRWQAFIDEAGASPASVLRRFLAEDLGNHARADGTAAFTDCETQAFFHRDRGDQLDGDRHVVARHNHLFVRRQLDRAGHVGGTEVELRTVVVEERGVTTALVLRQHVDLAGEVVVWLDRARLGQHLA